MFSKKNLILFFLFLVLSCGRKTPNDPQLFDFHTSSGKNDSVYLISGGGYDPNSSPVVLEKNVMLFNEIAQKYGIEDKSITRLFGAGNDSQIMDVMVIDSDFPLTDKLFAYLFDDHVSVGNYFRHNNLQNLDGKSDKFNLSTWFDVSSAELENTDSFRFYFTGHGSYQGDSFDKNILAPWSSTFSVQELTEKLDLLPKETLFQTVMVQCFSGGFSQINYAGGNLETKKLSAANRCGFFSTPASQPASG